ncbi:AMP-binding protein [Kocuria rhizophila]
MSPHGSTPPHDDAAPAHRGPRTPAPGAGAGATSPATEPVVPSPGADPRVASSGPGTSASGTELGQPLEAPQAAELPSDVVLLDGPVEGDPVELLPRLRAALSRPGPAVVVATSGSTGRPKKTVLSTEALTASGRATERATSGPGQWLLCLPAHYVAGVQVLARSVLAGTTPVVMTGEHFTPRAFADAAAGMDHPVRYVSVVPTQLQRILDPADGSPDPRAVAALARFDAVLVGGSPLSPALAAQADAAGVRVVRTYGMSETCGGCVYNGAPLDAVAVRILPDDAAPHLAHSPAPSAPPADEAPAGTWLAEERSVGAPPAEEAPAGTWFAEEESAGTLPAEAGSAEAPSVAAGSADASSFAAGSAGEPAPVAPTEGRIWLGGEVVASGYLDDPAQTAAHFRVFEGRRWYRTDDLGSMDEHGRLTVLGRTDDVINTGGVKVSAGRVAEVLLDHDRVRQALVLPVAHPEWGQEVAAVVAVRGPMPDEPVPDDHHSDGGPDHDLDPGLEQELAQSVRERLGAPAVPKRWRRVDRLPLLATGKPDRQAAAALFSGESGASPGAVLGPHPDKR